MKQRLLFVFLFSAWHAIAQNQHMNWVFGNGAALNFSTGSPVAFGGTSMATWESCASISDANGNLLFYTDGVDVWNANNTVMPNGSGLMGDRSAQCIIIPRPGNPGKYYVVSTDGVAHACIDGLRYSEVDMSLAGGNGDVTVQKNILLSGLAGEWVTAVKHANCTDTWIHTHGRASQSVLLAFHVSASGIDLVPVTTDLGISIPSHTTCAGILRPNPAGNKIAMSQLYAGRVELIDFDQATGMATGISNLYDNPPGIYCYGLEFSRSGNRLYTGESPNTSVGAGVFQYDLTAPDITASRTQISPPLSFSAEIGLLQIAPNDKIYVNYATFPPNDFIGVINDPELAGTACGFAEQAVSTGNTSNYGLPWYYNADLLMPAQVVLGPDTVLCPGNSVTLSNGSGNPPGATYLWSDGSNGPTLEVSEPGTYWVQYEVPACLPTTDTVIVTLDTTQIGHTVGDTSGCTPLTVELNGTSASAVSGWSWDMGNGVVVEGQHVSFQYTTPGVYTISLTALSPNNCLVADPLPVFATAYPKPAAYFTMDPLMADPGEPILFTDQTAGNIVIWLWEINGQAVSTSPTCTDTLENYYQPMIVSLTVTNEHDCSDERTMSVFKPEYLLYVPNSFTPDGNDFNNVFKAVDHFGLVREFMIYDRWGELVWRGTSAAEGWDGTYAGQAAMEGVYTWVIQLEINGVLSKQIEGHVTLLR